MRKFGAHYDRALQENFGTSRLWGLDMFVYRSSSRFYVLMTEWR